MATVNLGRIKPVFRGAFSNSTAYVIDDIVTSGNETFIAIAATQGNATTDASKWTKLAAKGADGSDGTDVAATLANKEISFKTNAGALDGIPIGTAGQFLKVNSGATGYEFGAVSVGALTLAQYSDASSSLSQVTTTSNQYSARLGSNQITVTPGATTDIIELRFYMSLEGTSQTSYCGFGVQKSTSSGSYSTATSTGNYMFMTGEHAISMGSADRDNRYRYVGATIKRSAADFGLSAGTTYYLSAHGVTHANNSQSFKFGYGSTNQVRANHFSLTRYTV